MKINVTGEVEAGFDRGVDLGEDAEAARRSSLRATRPGARAVHRLRVAESTASGKDPFVHRNGLQRTNVRANLCAVRRFARQSQVVNRSIFGDQARWNPAAAVVRFGIELTPETVETSSDCLDGCENRKRCDSPSDDYGELF